MVQSKRLHRGDQRPPPTPRNQQRLLPNLPRQRARERMAEKLPDLLCVARQERRAKTVQEGQHKNPVVFGVIYTL
jgi:hypothetical protein